MKNRCGIRHPDVVDLVTNGDDAFRLVLVEEQELTDDDALELQQKLNNYLGFALDGPLLERYPEASGKQACIRVDLYVQPSPFILEFLRQYAKAIDEYGVSFELSVNGRELEYPA
ncbi:hypothetical protein GCM10025771_13770 [Niveibacterium umoris]